jgi:hypothetical protein
MGNVAEHAGGAQGGTLNRCVILGNSATNQGGGASYSFLNNCVLRNNSAGYLGGGTDECWLQNCTLIGNSGGAVRLSWLRNCISFFNTPNNNDPDSDVSYSCTTPLPGNGTGNLTNTPLFIDLAGGNLRLQTNSPCINAGENSSAPGAADLDGRPRIAGGTVDLGAYEFQTDVSGAFLGWLQQHGLATDGSADLTDADSDLMNNWQEWIAGSDPTNASSVLRLLAPTNALSGVLVRWQSVTNRTYFLERGTNVASGSFSSIASNILGQFGATTFTDTNASGSGPFFYRVGVER